MRRGWRLSVLPGILLLPLLAGRAAGAAWDFTAPGDPARNWNVSASTGGTYDDNFFSTEGNRQSGFRSTSDIRLHANVPLDRLFVGGQYDYGIVYPHDVKLGGLDQSHTATVSAEYTVNPLLTLDLGENFISSLQPGLVLTPNNVPVTIASGGNYIYDSLNGGASYALSPRWTLAVRGGWDIWRYQTASLATNNDHEDYTATMSALYGLDPRTTIGLNYQYAQDVFVAPGINNGLNGYGNTVYLSATRRFNPRLSLALNGGYTIRNSDDGSQNTSPSGAGTVVYNYNVDSSISLTVAQALTEASFGVTRSFSAQENTSFALEVNHRISPRLRARADVTYVYSSFTAPLTPTVTVKPTEQAITSNINVTYVFREWLSANVNYNYSELTSPKVDLGGTRASVVEPYARNQISVGITVTY